MRFSLVVLAALVGGLLSGCPGGITPPPPDVPQPVKLTVSVSPDAPSPDPSDVPDVDGVLPQGIPSDVQMFDLGVLGIKDGESGDIFIDVTSGLGSFMVLVYGQTENTVILAKVVDPDGVLVISDIDQTPPLSTPFLKFAGGFPAQAFSSNRVLGSLGTGSFLVPNTPSVAAKSGKWKVRVGNYVVDLASVPPVRTNADRPVHVVILAKGQDTSHGKIDLNLHFTGSGGIDASSAPDDPLVKGALNVMKEAYAGAHIDIGEVRYLDVDPQFQAVSLVQDRCSGGDLDKVVALGAGDDPGIGLFFVDHFACIVGQTGVDVGASIGGIAAALPGPPWVQGTSHAGVAVSTAFSGGEPQPLGVVMAHETGHFLGLYHTRESGNGANDIFDEIDDTPNDGDAVHNLMYFAADTDTTLTDGQSHVLRTNPFVTYQ